METYKLRSVGMALFHAGGRDGTRGQLMTWVSLEELRQYRKTSRCLAGSVETSSMEDV